MCFFNITYLSGKCKANTEKNRCAQKHENLVSIIKVGFSERKLIKENGTTESNDESENGQE